MPQDFFNPYATSEDLRELEKINEKMRFNSEEAVRAARDARLARDIKEPTFTTYRGQKFKTGEKLIQSADQTRKQLGQERRAGMIANADLAAERDRITERRKQLDMTDLRAYVEGETYSRFEEAVKSGDRETATQTLSEIASAYASNDRRPTLGGKPIDPKHKQNVLGIVGRLGNSVMPTPSVAFGPGQDIPKTTPSDAIAGGTSRAVAESAGRPAQPGDLPTRAFTNIGTGGEIREIDPNFRPPVQAPPVEEPALGGEQSAQPQLSLRNRIGNATARPFEAVGLPTAPEAGRAIDQGLTRAGQVVAGLFRGAQALPEVNTVQPEQAVPLDTARLSARYRAGLAEQEAAERARQERIAVRPRVVGDPFRVDVTPGPNRATIEEARAATPQLRNPFAGDPLDAYMRSLTQGGTPEAAAAPSGPVRTSPAQVPPHRPETIAQVTRRIDELLAAGNDPREVAAELTALGFNPAMFPQLR